MQPVSATTSSPAETPRRAAIRADGVSVTYASGTEAVKNVSLTVPEGEFFGFLGPNGAGKTTTIKALVTLLDPTGGAVTVNGFDARRDRRALRGSIGYMAQETSIDLELTARENVRFACEAYGVPRGERTARIDDLLALVDLADVADDQAKTYSGGMKKRLDVATALVHRPPLVFLDEPTTGLDPKARNRLWEYFRRINEEGTTVFLTTQYLEEADQLCDRLAVIDDGRIVAEGTPAELKARVGGDVLSVDLVDADAVTVERAERVVRESGLLDGEGVVSRTDTGLSVTSQRARRVGTDLLVALRDAGILVEGFEVHSPTLDDVFLAITGVPAGERVAGANATTGAGR
ncbi:ABC transporter ATP-binding protein [Halomarina oriensis]|uniref:ATP-binding cassette domain-containing protein n=1 Tax=Halomarina oriensis TaxID=671145 RepID=A0A6B0GW68_9EURY|nr:ABC transporter ATP-binding protein [Halomarina oriensis]MWG36395.1 ATP-binding cassette domain-containing protein [Halomarina oriensis]